MKIKAVILRPDRTNDVVIIKPRKLEAGRFRFADCSYEVDEENFRLTWNRSLKKFGGNEYFSTYYYKQGVSKPLPVAELHELEEIQDISAEELAAIFNPWFYRIIAKQDLDRYSQIQFYLIIGLALGFIYLAYTLNGMSNELTALQQTLDSLMGGESGRTVSNAGNQGTQQGA